jgi:hypothetical protein
MAAMRVRDGRAIISVDGCTCPSKTWMIRISASGPRHLPRKSATDVEPALGRHMAREMVNRDTALQPLIETASEKSRRNGWSRPSSHPAAVQQKSGGTIPPPFLSTSIGLSYGISRAARPSTTSLRTRSSALTAHHQRMPVDATPDDALLRRDRRDGVKLRIPVIMNGQTVPS